jgi:hypothetical protein
MHGLTMKLLFEAIVAVLRRRVAGTPGHRAVQQSVRSTPARKAIPTVSLLLREAKGRPATVAMKRRTDGADWPETQPWCHQ